MERGTLGATGHLKGRRGENQGGAHAIQNQSPKMSVVQCIMHAWLTLTLWCVVFTMGFTLGVLGAGAQPRGRPMAVGWALRGRWGGPKWECKLLVAMEGGGHRCGYRKARVVNFTRGAAARSHEQGGRGGPALAAGQVPEQEGERVEEAKAVPRRREHMRICKSKHRRHGFG